MKQFFHLTKFLILFFTANASYCQWDDSSPGLIQTSDTVIMNHHVFIGDKGLQVRNQVVSGKFVDIADTNYICNPSYTSVFHSMKVTDDTTQTTMFAIDNDGTTHINATLKAKEIFVQADVWADHVFEEDYPLLPLPYIEQFIKENKHLPEIPSTKEVLDNGVNVSEMNMLLLKKIEELTLYTIQQQQQIETMRRQLNTLIVSKINE